MNVNNLPLWRLLVALDDAERSVGPDSGTARVLARVVQERLRQQVDDTAILNMKDFDRYRRLLPSDMLENIKSNVTAARKSVREYVPWYILDIEWLLGEVEKQTSVPENGSEDQSDADMVWEGCPHHDE